MTLIRRQNTSTTVALWVAVLAFSLVPACDNAQTDEAPEENASTNDLGLPEPVYADPPEERPELNDQLFPAIIEEDEERAIELIERGASVHAKDDRGISVLHFAARATMPDLIRLLCSYGADVDVTFGEDIQPIHWGARAGAADRPRREETIDVLLQYGADINARTSAGELPISYAFRVENEEWQEFMISRGSLTE